MPYSNIMKKKNGITCVTANRLFWCRCLPPPIVADSPWCRLRRLMTFSSFQSISSPASCIQLIWDKNYPARRVSFFFSFLKNIHRLADFLNILKALKKVTWRTPKENNSLACIFSTAMSLLCHNLREVSGSFSPRSLITYKKDINKMSK